MQSGQPPSRRAFSLHAQGLIDIHTVIYRTYHGQILRFDAAAGLFLRRHLKER